MKDEEALVTICETDSQSRVAVVKMALGEAEIPFIAVNDIVSTTYPIDGMAIVSFQVRQEDAEEARAVLDRLGFD